MQCEPWPLSSSCLPAGWQIDPATWDDAQAEAVEVATEILVQLTASRFGLCALKIRPCRRRCSQYLDSMRLLTGSLGVTPGFATGPWTPTLMDGRLYNIACGCVGECGCSPLSELTLDPFAYDVLEVRVDGAILASTAYRVDNNRTLVRLDGQRWPDCQELAQPDTAPDTWSVTYRTGTPIPRGGRMAVTDLAVNLWRACHDDSKCKLPARVTQIVREGVTYSLIDDLSVFDRGRTGLPRVDMWLASVNPYGNRAPLRAWSPDTVHHRRTTWPDPTLPVPPPPDGGGGSGPVEAYTFTQATPQQVWVITHGLGFRPAGVRVVDSTGTDVIGAVSYPSINVVRIDFSYPVSGIAYLS
jgi:hypothetical protein